MRSFSSSGVINNAPTRTSGKTLAGQYSGAVGGNANAGRKATALHYQPGEQDIAPVVVAQGRDDFAAQMVQLARAKGVKVAEDADLATLLEAAAVGEEIPLEAFLVIAEIFRYLYQEKGVEAPAVDGDPSPFWSSAAQKSVDNTS